MCIRDSRYTDRQQNTRVIRFHASGCVEHPEHAQRQRKERQCPFVVGVGGQIEAKIPDTQELARRKLEFELHVFTAFRQRQLNIAFPFARRQDKGARFDGRSVVAEPVSYTHLDVYKRQGSARAVRPRSSAHRVCGSRPA